MAEHPDFGKEIGEVMYALVSAAVKYQAGVKRAAIKDMRAGIERMRALLRMLGDESP